MLCPLWILYHFREENNEDNYHSCCLIKEEKEKSASERQNSDRKCRIDFDGKFIFIFLYFLVLKSVTKRGKR
jgi:hypothetical protein